MNPTGKRALYLTPYAKAAYMEPEAALLSGSHDITLQVDVDELRNINAENPTGETWELEF